MELEIALEIAFSLRQLGQLAEAEKLANEALSVDLYTMACCTVFKNLASAGVMVELAMILQACGRLEDAEAVLLARQRSFQPPSVSSASSFKHLESACTITLIGVLHAQKRYDAVAAERAVLGEIHESVRGMFVPGDTVAEGNLALALT